MLAWVEMWHWTFGAYFGQDTHLQYLSQNHGIEALGIVEKLQPLRQAGHLLISRHGIAGDMNPYTSGAAQLHCLVPSSSGLKFPANERILKAVPAR